jgi:ferredoxin--NADP+ reductase
MFRIVRKKELAPIIKWIDVQAPHIARKAQPGQFIIYRLHERGERVPLTIARTDPERGLISLIFQEVGKSTIELGRLDEGDTILDVVGPLGRPTELEKFGTVVCIGGGVGTAVIWPITAALKQKGNTILSIIGARTKELLILEGEIKELSDEFYVTTDDGSYGQKGFVSDILKRLLAEGRHIDRVYAIGPLPMMKVVCALTKEQKIPTIVSLNPIMVDGTGMCGSCRVSVHGKTYFTCVDGPEFDGHGVDWQELKARQSLFLQHEAIARQKCAHKQK